MLTPLEVLERYTDGPVDGVFTDGGSVPNPGPGGWGSVYVIDGSIVAEAHGHDPDTTNNRMELTALIEAAALVPEGTGAAVYSDSKLAVQTITEVGSGMEESRLEAQDRAGGESRSRQGRLRPLPGSPRTLTAMDSSALRDEVERVCRCSSQ